MKTIIIKAKTKKLKKEVQRKSRKTDGLEIQTWKEIDRSLPNVALSEKEVMEEVKAIRYGQ